MRATNTCECRWTSENGADTRSTIGDALPGLDPCAGHHAAIERAYRNGWKAARATVEPPRGVTLLEMLKS